MITNPIQASTRAAFVHRRGRSVTLRIPGSASNLGPGFDCLGLALSIYCRLTFTLLEGDDATGPMITFSGRVAKTSLPSDLSNLIYQIMRELWRDDPRKLQRIRIHVDSDIPLSCGLGSSVAVILGSLWADHVFNDVVPTTGSLLAQSASIVGHSETLAASLIGKCVIAAPASSSDKIVVRQLDWPSQWATIVVAPDYRLNTGTARSVLPQSVTHADAVFNLQRVALLVSAIASADESTLKEALNDRLHERHREELVAELPSLRRALVNQPVLGTVLCGGGPSVLVIAHQRHKREILDKLEKWSSSRSQPANILDLAVDNEGMKEI